MASDRSQKDKAMAAHLKAMGVTRTTGQCPWGCGKALKIGGAALLAHLGRCRGK
jgi:hypothetical protein